VVSILKVGLVYIVCEVLNKHIYLLALTCIVTVVNFIGKSKYSLFYF